MSWIEQPSSPIVVIDNHILNLTLLKRDEYYLWTTYAEEKDYSLWTKLEECYECPFLPKLLKITNEGIYKMNSKFASEWQVKSKTNGVIEDACFKFKPDVSEFGVYKLLINSGYCELETYTEPVNIYLPIVTVIGIFTLVGLILYLFFYGYDKFFKNNSGNIEEPKKQRVLSLDTFRGISIAVMIFVNYGGGAYNFTEHAVWNGLTIADLVFPWFLWIMGVCIPISIKSAIKREGKKYKIFLNILRRSIILFMLGLCLNGIETMETLRIFGVLQRLSLCYFFIASLNLFLTIDRLSEVNIKFGKDIFILLPQWLIIILIVLIHTICIIFVEIPDVNDCAGYLGPGGQHQYPKYVECPGGLSNYIDKQFLGIKHLYARPTFLEVYYSGAEFIPFDPEGFFSTLPALLTVFLGVQAGTTMQIYKNHIPRIVNWLIGALITGLIGGILCNFSKESGYIPVNKNLWSLSYVLVTACFAYILLTLLYVIMDMNKLWNGKPFIFAGMNAIILYVGHNLTYDKFPFQWGTVSPNLHFQLLSQAVWGTMCWTLVAYWLFRIKFFLSI